MSVSTLKIARITSGIKQWRLANIIGISQAELSNYEIGRRRCPADMRHKIAQALSKPVDEVFPEYLENERSM